MIHSRLIVESDAPVGMTLREWRASRTPARQRPLLMRLVRRIHKARSCRGGWPAPIDRSGGQPSSVAV